MIDRNFQLQQIGSGTWFVLIDSVTGTTPYAMARLSCGKLVDWKKLIEPFTMPNADERTVFSARALKLFAAGTVNTYPPEPAKPKPSRTERNAELVEKRAAHAAKMLTNTERKLRVAKTVHSRWKTKVRYYEKVAAKRSGGGT